MPTTDHSTRLVLRRGMVYGMPVGDFVTTVATQKAICPHDNILERLDDKLILTFQISRKIDHSNTVFNLHGLIGK